MFLHFLSQSQLESGTLGAACKWKIIERHSHTSLTFKNILIFSWSCKKKTKTKTTYVIYFLQLLIQDTFLFKRIGVCLCGIGDLPRLGNQFQGNTQLEFLNFLIDGLTETILGIGVGLSYFFMPTKYPSITSLSGVFKQNRNKLSPLKRLTDEF